MACVEKKSIAAGARDDLYMEQAGRGVAVIADQYGYKEATLFVGKGNNGGDAFVCGIELLKKGYAVRAYRVFDEATPLCTKYGEWFEKEGGQITRTLEPIRGVVIDGIVGTGYAGAAEGVVLEAIQAVNDYQGPVIAIDVPSGLDATTGNVGSVAIRATETVTLGMPKIGLFLSDGMNQMGTLRIVDFGLDSEEADPTAYLVDEKALLQLVPKVKRTRHKYQAGYVIAFAGSSGMSGAALLATYAAMRTGAGIVRLFHEPGIEPELAASPYELIKAPWDRESVLEELERASSVLIGPGLGRSAEYIEDVVEAITVPSVIDADGLFLLKNELRMPVVITPHKKEMERVLGDTPTLERCQAFAEKKSVTIVLKGAPTYIFHPKKVPLIVYRGDPGMATAGSGDVLTGVIAGLLAQGLPPREAATLGVYLHGVAGEIAASEMTSYSMIASDIIEALAGAFLQTMQQSE